MGVAAYNRGSRAIREALDREIQERKVVKRTPIKPPRVAARGECELCFAKLGVRSTEDRGCVWSEKERRWFDACYVCKQQVRMENRP